MTLCRNLFFHFIREHRFLYFTYLIILFIPLTAFCLCIVNAGSIMRQDAHRYQNSVLTHEKSVCDNAIHTVRIAVSTAAFDTKTAHLKTETVFSPVSMLSAAELSDTLYDIRKNHSHIESLGIYFYRNDSFVTDTKRYASALYPSYLERYGLTQERLTADTTDYSGYLLWNAGGSTWLLIYQNLYDHSLKEKTALAYAILPWSTVQDAISYTDAPDGEALFVIAPGDFLFGCSDPSIPAENFPGYETLNAQAAGHTPFSLTAGRTGLVTVAASDELPFYYGMYLEKDKFYHEIDLLILKYVTGLVCCILTGICAAFYFTKKNAAPVGYLLSLVNDSRRSGESPKLGKSYQQLENALLNLLRSNRNLSRQVSLHTESVFETTLCGFLKGLYPNEDLILEFHDSEPALCGITHYQVAVFTFPGIETCGFIRQQGESQKTWSLLFFSLRNVIDEAFLKKTTHAPRGVSLLLDGMLVCIFSPVQGKNNRQILAADAGICIDFFQKVFSLDCQVAFSRIHALWTGLADAYKEALTTASHIAFWGDPSAVSFWQDEAAEASPQRNELLQLKKNLANSLMVDNFVLARQVIGEITGHYFLHDVRHFSYNQCQSYALISMLLDKLRDMGMDQEISEKYTARLLRAQTNAQLQQAIDTVFSEILHYQDQNTSASGWAGSVKDYIRENYQNPDLNVAFIAEHFGVSAAHIGNRFRKLTGTGIPDYIHMTRLEKCKELLAEGSAIRDCVSRTGYTDIKTLQRAFKRYEGMTPGQYREQSCGSARDETRM